MRCLCLLALLAATALLAQPKLEFEVASIKPSPPVGPSTEPGCRGGPGSEDPSRLICEQMSPAVIIMIAYDVKYVQLVGPDWLATPRLDIQATVPPGTTKQQIAEMWRDLLAGRFHLVSHRDAREQTQFDLIVAKGGAKMKPAGAAPGPSRPGGMGMMPDGSMNMHFPRITMASLAATLGNRLHQFVTDATGLTGAYDMQLRWTPELKVAAGIDAPPPLPQALEDQLGLRLLSKKGPVDMLVVDHIDRTPTQN